MSDTTERQSLLLPVLMPVGLLVIIALVLFGLSRILLAISHAAATVVALVGLVVVVAVAAFVASRPAGERSLLDLDGLGDRWRHHRRGWARRGGGSARRGARAAGRDDRRRPQRQRRRLHA